MSRFARFTDLAGNEVWIVKQWVTKVSIPTRGVWPANARAILSMGANEQAVMQTVEESIRLLEGD